MSEQVNVLATRTIPFYFKKLWTHLKLYMHCFYDEDVGVLKHVFDLVYA